MTQPRKTKPHLSAAEVARLDRTIAVDYLSDVLSEEGWSTNAAFHRALRRACEGYLRASAAVRGAR